MGVVSLITPGCSGKELFKTISLFNLGATGAIRCNPLVLFPPMEEYLQLTPLFPPEWELRDHPLLELLPPAFRE